MNTNLTTYKKAFILIFLSILFYSCNEKKQKFPDGSEISPWFFDHTKIELSSLGKQYNIIEFGAVGDSITMNTEAIQKTIDKAAEKGGVVVIPEGIFLSGALFFKPGTHLHVMEGGELRGSDTISDFPSRPSRIEGQLVDYFPALINAYGVNGFTITGKGTINGNGLKYWKAFWARRKEKPECTNLEVSRPRLIFIWDCDNVQIQDIHLINSGFWTTHFYKCNNIKMLDAYIFAPKNPVPAPSSDALDIDICTNVLVKGCYMSVNDDAITLKGGKGPWADKDTANGPNFNVLIEDCSFGWCHAVLTCGSESIHNRNILFRNSTVNGASRLLFLKMRPDTPQNYEYLTIENIKGTVRTCIFINPWKQFFDLKDRKSPPISTSQNFMFKDLTISCNRFVNIGKTEYDVIKNFHFENLNITAKKGKIKPGIIEELTMKNVTVNNEKLEIPD